MQPAAVRKDTSCKKHQPKEVSAYNDCKRAYGLGQLRRVRKTRLRPSSPFSTSSASSVSIPNSPLGTVPAMTAAMIFYLLAHGWSLLLDLIMLIVRSDRDKDIEILLLRQQLRILQRKHPHPPRISRWEKLSLLIVTGKLTALTNSGHTRLGQVIVLVKPETLSWLPLSSGAKSARPCRSWLPRLPLRSFIRPSFLHACLAVQVQSATGTANADRMQDPRREGGNHDRAQHPESCSSYRPAWLVERRYPHLTLDQAPLARPSPWHHR